MSFRDLHYADEPLLLPNAWDVSSALAFYDAGYRAVGTTSFGVAASAGHPDGGRSSKEPTSSLVRQLRSLPVYVSADVEDGYDDDPDVVAGHVAGLGVAGINIEDSTDEKLISPQAHAAKVSAIKKRSPEVFVNARVDTYWLGQDANVAATLNRAEAYVEAGADGNPGRVGTVRSTSADGKYSSSGQCARGARFKPRRVGGFGCASS
jgi:2-methylisocitrate lyase-like PEP mutase family enzyme